MARSLCLLLGLWFCLAPAGARSLVVTSDCPATFSWRDSRQGGEWQRFSPPGLTNRAVLERPADTNEVDIRCVGIGVFMHRVGVRTRVSSSLGQIDVGTELVPNPAPLGLLGGTVLLALSLGAVHLVRRRGQRKLEESTAQLHQVLEASLVATLFRTDGTHPERIGAYRVRRLLGVGGMAMVYEVQSPDGHACALKLPLLQFGNDPEFRQRFAREMRVSSQLMHPNVVRIEFVQIPSSPEEYPYYAMELVSGSSWEDLLQKGLPEPRLVIQWTRGVLQGLEHVHARNIVHRDIKPANIVISTSGMAKLMDFGIAKDLTTNTLLTRPDQAVGTPAYMAPEQLTNQPLGPATDLYAVGLVVYRSLAGQLPFEEDNLPAVLSSKLQGAELPPLERLDLPPELTDWVMRLVAADPARRFASAAEARVALERVASRL